MTDQAGLIPLGDAQKRLPGNPSLRWLSTEARRLGCYRRVGKEAFIIERAWTHFVEGRQYEPDREKNLFETAKTGHWIYFIAADDFVKIGIAGDVRKRFDALQTGSAAPLSLLGIINSSVARETDVHARFAHLRERGEWFRFAPEMLAFIKEAGHG